MSAKKTVSSVVLRNQKAEAQARLDELRQRQIDAIEQGETPQHDDEITQIKERLTAVDAAITRAEAREQKESDEKTLQATRLRAGDLISEIESAEDARLEKLSEAQRKFQEATHALAEFFSLSEDQHHLLKQTSVFVGSQPEERRRIKGADWFSPQRQEVPEAGRDRVNTRLGDYLCGTISTIFDGALSGQHGALAWSSQGADQQVPWADRERNAFAGLLQGEIRSLRYVLNAIPEKPHAEAE